MEKNDFDKEILNNPDLRARLYRQYIREEEQREKRKNANPNFLQVSDRNLVAIQMLTHQNGLAGSIFFFFCENMNGNNSIACSYKVLEEYFGASRMSVYRAIKLLKERNFIDISKMGNVNVYHLNEQLVWRKAKNKRKYAKFSATIILSEEEQNNHKQIKKEMQKINVVLKEN